MLRGLFTRLSGLQGLPRAAVERQAEELLESVKLTAAASARTGAYSGGMRRRLRWVLCLWVEVGGVVWVEG